MTQTLCVDWAASYDFQYKNNAIYRKFCDTYYPGLRPGTWEQIPALPISAFKTHEVISFPSKEIKHTFLTSGTTLKSERGKHSFKTLEYYNQAIGISFKEYVMQRTERISIATLIPPFSEKPESSLSYMTDHVMQRFGRGEPYHGLRNDEVDFEGLYEHLKGLSGENTPYLLMATTFSLASFLDYLEMNNRFLRSTPGSRIMDTGGYKARRKEISRDMLLARIQKYLSVPENNVINEYGMTELSSQFYSRGKGEKRIPSWTRVRVVNPATGKDAPRGHRGLIQILDLANQGSVIAIQTEDEGRMTPHGFEVLGRNSDTDLRGCSLTFEMMEEAKR